jgi:hypothetical protein
MHHELPVMAIGEKEEWHHLVAVDRDDGIAKRCQQPDSFPVVDLSCRFVPCLPVANCCVEEAKGVPVLKGLILITDDSENPRLIVDGSICSH